MPAERRTNYSPQLVCTKHRDLMGISDSRREQKRVLAVGVFVILVILEMSWACFGIGVPHEWLNRFLCYHFLSVKCLYSPEIINDVSSTINLITNNTVTSTYYNLLIPKDTPASFYGGFRQTAIKINTRRLSAGEQACRV